MKIKMLLLPVLLSCLYLSAFGQVLDRKDSVRLKKVIDQRVKDGQQTVLKQLSNFHTYDSFMNGVNLSFNTKPFYNEEAREMLLSLIRDRWPDPKKQLVAKQFFESKIRKDIEDLENHLKDTTDGKIWVKKRERLSGLLDSLRSVRRKDLETLPEFQKKITEFKEELEKQKVPNELIYTSAMLEDERYIIVLKEALKDSLHYDPYTVRMALARYGLEPFKSEMLELNRIDINAILKNELVTFQYEIEKRLFYLCTNESVYEYAEFLSVDYHELIEADDYVLPSIPSIAVSGLSVIILNQGFQSYISQIENVPEGVKREHIEWIKSWMEKNYGNYNLSRDYYPGLN